MINLLFLILPFFVFKAYADTTLGQVEFADELNYTATNMIYPELWLQTNGNKNFYNFNGNILIGRFGGGETVTRKFSNLPPHNEIRINFQVIQMDTWDEEVFIMMVDGAQVYSVKFNTLNTPIPCWGCNLKTVVDKKIAHTGSSLEIILTSTLNELNTNESWGINFFKLFLTGCPNECLTCSDTSYSEQCNTCLSSTILKTINGNQKCSKCNSYCKTCSGETQNDCTSCFENAVLSGSTCACKPNYYLSSISPFLCKTGTTTILDPVCIDKMDAYYNRVEMIHWCDFNSTTQITNLKIQLTPFLPTFTECYNYKLLVINDLTGTSTTNIANYKVSSDSSATIFSLDITRSNYLQYGCAHVLTDEIDRYICRLVFNFKYGDLVQEIKEFIISNTIYRKLNQEISLTINPRSGKSICLKPDSCNNTIIPKSKLYFCDDSKCTILGTKIVFARGSTIYVGHSLEDVSLRAFYDLEKIKQIITIL